VVIAVTIAATLFFLRNRGFTVNSVALTRLWRGVVGWLSRLWQGVGGQLDGLERAIRARLAPATKAADAAPSWRYVRLNALSPREQVRYFYLATVRRAGERGVRRHRAETPLEFAEELRQNWPEAEDEVEALTDAFLQARYSPQVIGAEAVNPIKAAWKRVRSALRRVAQGTTRSD
jgi:hypothetical protein